MPTGYTYYINDGEITNGKDFILLCARAFGACISMKEDSLDKPIPDEFKPSEYHTERIKEEKERLEQYKKMTMEEAKDIVENNYIQELIDHEKCIKEKLDLRTKYLNIIDDVKKWNPPTSEHINLKNFALEQLQMSLNQDCNIDYYLQNSPKKQETEEYIKNMIESCKRSIAYHVKENKNEIDRINQRNEWIKKLRESLD